MGGGVARGTLAPRHRQDRAGRRAAYRERNVAPLCAVTSGPVRGGGATEAEEGPGRASMAEPGRDPRSFCDLMVAAVVLLCWGFVLYGARVIAQRQLESGVFGPALP